MRDLVAPSKLQSFQELSYWHFACGALLETSCFRTEQMGDVIFIVITVVFFIIACAYVSACDRL